MVARRLAVSSDRFMNGETGKSDRMPLAYGLAVFAIVGWGITPAVTAIQVTELPPVEAGMMRSVLAVPPALLCICLLRLAPPRRLETWGWLLFAGFAAFCGFPILFTMGVAQTSTAHAALILACMPVIAGGVGAVLDRRMPRPGWFLGAAIAMVGEAVLIGSRDSSGVATLQGDLLVVLAAAISAVGYVAGSRATREIGSWSTTFWGVVIAGSAQIPLFWWLASGIDWSAVTHVGWLSTLYLVMYATILSYAAWYWALNHGSVVRIAPIQFAQPVVSLIFAVAVLSEPITTPIMIAVVLVLAGIVLASRAQRVS